MLAGIVRNEGIPALYVGCAPALVAMVPSGAVYYWLYDMLKEKHLKHVSKTTGGPSFACPSHFFIGIIFLRRKYT